MKQLIKELDSIVPGRPLADAQLLALAYFGDQLANLTADQREQLTIYLHAMWQVDLDMADWVVAQIAHGAASDVLL